LFGSSTIFLKSLPQDLLAKELMLYGGLLILMFWLGLT
jgi:hypothetical protein